MDMVFIFDEKMNLIENGRAVDLARGVMNRLRTDTVHFAVAKQDINGNLNMIQGFHVCM